MNHNFRKAFVESIVKARKEGQINVLEAAVLRAASWDEKKLRLIQDNIEEEAALSGTELKAIDWAKLIELLIQFLPVILAFFK